MNFHPINQLHTRKKLFKPKQTSWTDSFIPNELRLFIRNVALQCGHQILSRLAWWCFWPSAITFIWCWIHTIAMNETAVEKLFSGSLNPCAANVAPIALFILENVNLCSIQGSTVQITLLNSQRSDAIKSKCLICYCFETTINGNDTHFQCSKVTCDFMLNRWKCHHFQSIELFKSA